MGSCAAPIRPTCWGPWAVKGLFSRPYQRIYVDGWAKSAAPLRCIARCTAHCPQTVRWCIAGVALPTTVAILPKITTERSKSEWDRARADWVARLPAKTQGGPSHSSALPCPQPLGACRKPRRLLTAAAGHRPRAPPSSSESSPYAPHLASPTSPTVGHVAVHC